MLPFIFSAHFRSKKDFTFLTYFNLYVSTLPNTLLIQLTLLSSHQFLSCYKILWNLKVQFRVRKSLSLVPILSHINHVHTTQSYFSKIHFYIILLSTSRSS
jgi:hypothetical protein